MLAANAREGKRPWKVRPKEELAQRAEHTRGQLLIGSLRVYRGIMSATGAVVGSQGSPRDGAFCPESGCAMELA